MVMLIDPLRAAIHAARDAYKATLQTQAVKARSKL